MNSYYSSSAAGWTLSAFSYASSIASVLLDDSFAVHDIRIIEGEKGLFIAMPSKKTPTGEYRDIAHPITPECRKMFEDAVLEEYNKQLNA